MKTAWSIVAAMWLFTLAYSVCVVRFLLEH